MKTQATLLATLIVVVLSFDVQAGPSSGFHHQSKPSTVRPASHVSATCYVIKRQAGNLKPVGLRKKVAVPCIETLKLSKAQQQARRFHPKK